MSERNKSPQLDRLIILLNPTSTNHEHAKKYVSEIERLFPKKSTTILQTSPDGKEATASILREHASILGPRTLLCIVAGDGTVNFIVNFLLTDESLPKKARATVLLPLWGGNGNDMSTMLNGRPGVSKVKKIFEHGQIVKVKPLYCRMMLENQKPALFLAGNCLGFGASGSLCFHLNSKAHRESALLRMPGGTLPQTIATVWSGLNTSSGFDIFESGTQTTIYERTIYNGPVVAKYYHQPVQLLDDYFYMDTWHSKIPVTTPLSALLSFQRRTLRRSKNHYFKKAAFTILSEVWAQFDGEPYKVVSNTKIEIGIYEQPFYALSMVIKGNDLPAA